MVYLDCLLLVFASVQILIKYFFVFFSRALSCAFFLAYWFFLCVVFYIPCLLFISSPSPNAYYVHMCVCFFVVFFCCCVLNRVAKCAADQREKIEEKKKKHKKRVEAIFFLVVNLYRDHSKL